MASRKRRYRKIEEDDKFETEAFEYLNDNLEKQTSQSQETSGEAESDVEIAGIVKYFQKQFLYRNNLKYWDR